MKLLPPLLASLTLALSSTTLWAQAVKVEQAWVRGTVSPQKATGAFMRLTPESAARLVAARSPVAGVVEIHEMTMVDHVMRMRAIPGLDLPAGRTTELKPGGYHVMLMDLKQVLNGGDVVPLTLEFQDAAGKRFTQEVQAPVTALGAGNAAPKGGHGGMKH